MQMPKGVCTPKKLIEIALQRHNLLRELKHVLHISRYVRQLKNDVILQNIHIYRLI